MTALDDDRRFMSRALELARRGEGHVEPNPMVGAVVVRGGQILGEGWHERFGGPHAEVNALATAGEAARRATLYASLEPCCHMGKTPPCTEAIIAAGVARVVVAAADPFPEVNGGGFARLREAGIACTTGVLEEEARRLLAPYLKLTTAGRPWVIAKWAMTLDGKLATRTGSSQWITGEAARREVHALRGRVDAILVGAGTVRSDDPLLTARPPGPRTATRIVLGDVPRTSRLAATMADAPLMVVTSHEPPAAAYEWLCTAGGELLVIEAATRGEQIERLLDELGRRRMTNLLVEGGATVLGEFFDLGAVDEIMAFIAAKIVGGREAPSPVGGNGVDVMDRAVLLAGVDFQVVENEIRVSGRLRQF